MAGDGKLTYRVKEFLRSLPGKRGIDIPETDYDRIHEAASGITQSVWGRYPTPEMMQHMYDNGIHHPESIKAWFGKMPHPHAPSVTVDEYPAWSQAYEVHRQHS